MDDFRGEKFCTVFLLKSGYSPGEDKEIFLSVQGSPLGENASSSDPCFQHWLGYFYLDGHQPKSGSHPGKFLFCKSSL